MNASAQKKYNHFWEVVAEICSHNHEAAFRRCLAQKTEEYKSRQPDTNVLVLVNVWLSVLEAWKAWNHDELDAAKRAALKSAFATWESHPNHRHHANDTYYGTIAAQAMIALGVGGYRIRELCAAIRNLH